MKNYGEKYGHFEMNQISGQWRRWLAPIIVLIVALSIPAMGSALWLKVFTSVAIYTITALGISLLYRRLGQVSLAHVALMGCGGWVTLRLSHAFHLPFEFQLFAGGVFTAIVGMVLAYPALRMRGLYLALVTLMAAGGFSILIGIIQFPNGGDGFAGYAITAITHMERPYLAQSDEVFFVYCIMIAVLAYALVYAHEHAKPGRAWALIRRSEASAMAAGINVTFYKVWGFALSGFLAGIAGGLLAGSLQFLDARSFPVGESVMIFALTVVGGAWHWFGAIIAALLFRLMPALLNDWGVSGDAAFIFFGAALMHALATAPKGIAGQIAGLASRLMRSGDRHD